MVIYSFSNNKNSLVLLVMMISIGYMPLIGQDSVISSNGVEVVLPSKTAKKLNSYLSLNGGLQKPYMLIVPMIPESTPADNFIEETVLMALAEGYSFGIGLLNKTNPYLDVGLLADYYNNSVPITRVGERSRGPWVFEQTNETSNLTEPFENDNNRVSEVYVIRATIRLKLPLGPINIWAGITGGSYTSTVRFTERDEVSFFNSASKTLIAPSYQTGIDFMIKNKQEEDIFSITFFADFSSPKMEESIYDTVVSGWDFTVPEGNSVISPVRFGLAIGIH